MHPEWLRLSLSYLNVETERVVHVGWWRLRSAPTPLFIAIRTCVHAIAALTLSGLSVRGAWMLPRGAAKVLFGIQGCAAAAAACATFGLAHSHSSSFGDRFGDLILFILVYGACAAAAASAAAVSMLYGAVSFVKLVIKRPRPVECPAASEELGRAGLMLALARRFHSL